jgi:hypothetical protein
MKQIIWQIQQSTQNYTNLTSYQETQTYIIIIMTLRKRTMHELPD